MFLNYKHLLTNGYIQDRFQGKPPVLCSSEVKSCRELDAFTGNTVPIYIYKRAVNLNEISFDVCQYMSIKTLF